MLALFDKLPVESDEFRQEFRDELRQTTNRAQQVQIERARESQQELESIRQQ
jgi:hypothetical protein